MQVSIENKGELGRILKVQVPSENIDSQVNQRIKDLGAKVKINGFRPGRIPHGVIQQRFGSKVRQEVVGEVIQTSFQQALSDNDLMPAGLPEINASKQSTGQDLEFTATFEIFPKLENINLGTLKVEKISAEIVDDDIENMIATLQQQKQEWKDKKSEAKKDDLVVAELIATVGKKKIPAEGAEKIGLILGSETLGKSLEKALSGVKAGDKKQCEVEFPQEFSNKDLAGVKANAEITILKVAESKLPTVDKSFIKSFGVESGKLTDFKKNVRNNLTRELDQALLVRNKQYVIDALFNHYKDLQLPENFVEQEIKQIKKSLSEHNKIDDKNIMQQAKKRIIAMITLGEIAQQNKITVDDEQVNKRIAEIAVTYEQPEQVVQFYHQNHAAMEKIRSSVLEDQVIGFILEKADITEKKSNFDEILRPNSIAK